MRFRIEGGTGAFALRYQPARGPMLTILIIVLIILALGGGGYGYRSGWYGGPRGRGFNGLGLLPIVLIILVIYLLFSGGFGPGVGPGVGPAAH